MACENEFGENPAESTHTVKTVIRTAFLSFMFLSSFFA
jgi:hypothetical protein